MDCIIIGMPTLSYNCTSCFNHNYHNFLHRNKDTQVKISVEQKGEASRGEGKVGQTSKQDTSPLYQ